jgi:hypothetical protein
MPLWEALLFALLGVLIFLLPIGVIGVFASRLQPHEKTGFLVIYGGAVLLVAVVGADIEDLLPVRLAIDLALLTGGLLLGLYAGRLLTVGRSDRQHQPR